MESPLVGRPSPKNETPMSSRPCFLKASAWPTAVGMPSAMMPLHPKCVSVSKRCMCPPLPCPRPVSLPKISAAIFFMSMPCARATGGGRCGAVTASDGLRCAQTPTATGSWPAARCISPGTGPAAMSKAGVFPSM